MSRISGPISRTAASIPSHTSGKWAKGCWPIFPLVPVFLQTGTKGWINTGSRAQASNTGSCVLFSTGSWHEPVLKGFPPNLLHRWGMCCTFSTGLLYKPVLEVMHPISSARPSPLFHLQHISKYFSPLTPQQISIFLHHLVKIGGNHLYKG